MLNMLLLRAGGNRMRQEQAWTKWEKKGKRLNLAWFLCFSFGMIIVMFKPQGYVGWVIGSSLLIVGIAFNRWFFRHIRVRPCDIEIKT